MFHPTMTGTSPEQGGGVKNMQIPESKSDMVRFMGMVTYLRKCDLSDHTALLRELMCGVALGKGA